jgi:signal transduction histidine kinase
VRAGSLAARLTLVQQITALAIIVAFAGSSLVLTAHVLHKQQDAFLQENAQRMARAYDEELQEQRDPARAAARVFEEEAAPGARVEIRDAAGGLVARAPRPSTNRSARRTPPRGGGDSMVVVARTAHGSTIRVSMSDRLERASLAALGGSLLVSALPLLLAGLILSRWIAQRALRPLSAMANRAESTSIGKSMRSLGEPTGLEEIDRLGQSFDRLLQRLDDALRAERQFTADASHELRTPLTVLSGELEIASGLTRGHPALEASLASASEQVRAMRELVEAILLLHRSGEGARTGESAFEPVNLSDLVRELADESVPRYPGRRGDITVEAPDEVLVSGHPALLTSALRNLLDNSLKFTRAGDAVRIAVGVADSTSRVVVEDGGPGIPPAEQSRVFDPFFRGSEARAGGSGFGLGLPILRRVARAHGGDVLVGSSGLGGARFVLTLPAMDADA